MINQMKLHMQAQALEIMIGRSNSIANPSDNQSNPFQVLLEQVLHSQLKLQSSMNKSTSPHQDIAQLKLNLPKTVGNSNIQSIVSNVSNRYDIDEKLIHAIIKVESNYDHQAVSHAGAQGLMQLMPGTARSLGVNNPFDPLENIEGGTKYLHTMLKRYNGNLSLALAAYNAGPGNVDKYQGIPPFEETQNYVKKVLNNYHA